MMSTNNVQLNNQGVHRIECQDQQCTMMPAAAAAKATELNNQGVHYIECGEYRKAISFFTRGVSIVREELAKHYKDHCKNISCDEQGCTDPEETHGQEEEEDCFTPLCPFHKLSENFENDETVADNQQSFIFKNAIFISTELGMNDNGYTHNVKLSFIQLYNLALANHLLALDTNKNSRAGPQKDSTSDVESRRLKKALVLYELVYTLQLENKNIQPSALQVMAIVNNLGQVHRALNDPDKARACFENLLSTLVFVANFEKYHDHQDDANHHRQQEMDGFLRNVLPLIFAKGSMPASAA